MFIPVSGPAHGRVGLSVRDTESGCCFFFFQAEDGIRDAQESRGLSCSCLSVYRCHSAVMAAVSHSTPDTQFREGSSLQDGLYARTPRSVRPLRLIR